MAKFVVPEDVAEQILIKSEVKDLLRFKSVCKSWHSLIKSSRFINRHLKHNYNKDRSNFELGHRRIILDHSPPCPYYFVGSSNGLVCIISIGFGSYVRGRKLKVLIGNPLTREVRQLKLPLACEWFSMFNWGFGYDSLVDDYKVVVGLLKDNNRTCFQVFSLKSNVWKVIGEVKYRFISKVGILCNGALHWIVTTEQNYKKQIMSYDLSKEEFKEIPQPDVAGYKFTSSSYLGVMKESLCIFNRARFVISDIWFMKNYNVKESWELLPCVYGINDDIIVHFLRMTKEKSLFHDVALGHHGFYRKWEYIDAPIFVESLVSPHVVNGRPSVVSTSDRPNTRPTRPKTLPAQYKDFVMTSA